MLTETVFPPVDISIKLAISVGIGMLVGLEREWSQKELGTRTFTIVAMGGALSFLGGLSLALVAFVGVLVVLVLTGARNVRESKPVETTTSAALIVTFVLGVLVGQGHHYTPVAAAIIMTMFLSVKPALTHFAGGLQPGEVRSAVLLGLFSFVIYPVLPDRTIDPFALINPREAWLTVILIAALGFANYVLLKLYGSRGLLYSAVLGGMVNSTATIAELTGFLAKSTTNALAIATVINFLTIVAMFVRNLVIVGVSLHTLPLNAGVSLAAMSVAALACILQQRKHGNGNIGELALSSPLSLPKVLKFGLIFLLIEIMGTLGERYFGHSGFLLVSIVGGFVSSASTTGAAALLAMHGKISPQTAGMATVLTSMASALSNLPLLHQQTRNWPITRRLTLLSIGVVCVGAVAMLISNQVLPR